MLVQILPTSTDLDESRAASDRNWHASPHAKFERLLRETEVPIGLLVNGSHLRLVYAPRGETSGYMTFSVADMSQVAGRPIFAALHMLLCAERLFSLPAKQRLPAILADSRKYQNVVSTQLADKCWRRCSSCCAGSRRPMPSGRENCCARYWPLIRTTSTAAC